MRFCLRTFAALAALSTIAAVQAQIPALSSRPGAAYTLYLNFGGFSYTGTWSSGTPGVTPAYSGTTAQIREAWARVAEKYVSLNVNVTTVDPAVAAGQAATDAQRQSYYDSQARMMHTVIGGTGGWTGGGGVSFLNVISTAQTNGRHTNWVFANQGPGDLQFVADATSHENGHAFGLNHQGDWNVSGQGNAEYSSNFNSGEMAPIMGVTYNSSTDPRRGLWRRGRINTSNTVQNDFSVFLGNSGAQLVDSGIGHTFATATQLGLIGTTVDPNLAKGWLNPASATTPNPTGEANYTKDYFKFTVGQAGTTTLTLNSGGQWLATGQSAPGRTFRGKFNILNSSQAIVGTSTEASDTLSASFTGSLGLGNYVIEVLNFGGMTSTIDTSAEYYTSGSYFFTGVVPVPEPTSMVALGLGAIALVRRRRKQS
jgi:hypothetical protein